MKEAHPFVESAADPTRCECGLPAHANIHATLPASSLGHTVSVPTPSAAALERVAPELGHPAGSPKSAETHSFVETAAYLRRLVDADVPGLVQKSSQILELLAASEREVLVVRRQRDEEARKFLDASRLHDQLTRHVRRLRRALFVSTLAWVALAGVAALAIILR